MERQETLREIRQKEDFKLPIKEVNSGSFIIKKNKAQIIQIGGKKLKVNNSFAKNISTHAANSEPSSQFQTASSESYYNQRDS